LLLAALAGSEKKALQTSENFVGCFLWKKPNEGVNAFVKWRLLLELPYVLETGNDSTSQGPEVEKKRRISN